MTSVLRGGALRVGNPAAPRQQLPASPARVRGVLTSDCRTGLFTFQPFGRDAEPIVLSLDRAGARSLDDAFSWAIEQRRTRLQRRLVAREEKLAGATAPKAAAQPGHFQDGGGI